MISLERHDDVLRIRLSSPGSRAVGLDVSAYLLRGVLVDSGFPFARRAMARVLDEHRVEGAILTHWHEDHAGNATLIAERGIPIQAAPETLAILRRRPGIRAYRRLVWGHPPAFSAAHQPFEHGAFAFLHTPGHSEEHHAVFDAETETLFSGDLWLGVRSRVMHEHENPRQIVDSLRRVIALRPRRMFDAHRGPVADPVHALTAKAEWMASTIHAIEAKLAAGWSDRAIVKEVLGGEERSAWFSFGEYARRNFVRAVKQDTGHRTQDTVKK